MLHWKHSDYSGCKPTHLTSVVSIRTSVFITSWYYANGFCGCLIRMLDGLVSTHTFSIEQFTLTRKSYEKRVSFNYELILTSMKSIVQGTLTEKEGLSTIDLLVKVACLVKKKVKNVCIIKSC